MQRHCRWRRCCRLRCCRFRDSVAVSCIAACCASLPAEHCRPQRPSASLQLHFIRALPPCSQHCAGCGARHSQLARGSTPRQAGLARLCRSQNLSSASGLAIGVATPPTVSCQSHCCVRLLLAQQRAPQNTYSSQHSLLARGSIPRQVESNTKVTALCTARISICAVCALAVSYTHLTLPTKRIV